MATAIIRPDGSTVTQGGFQVTGAGGSLHGAVNDQNDTTWVNDTFSAGPSRIVYDFPTVAIPAGAQIRSVTPVVRISTGGISQGVYIDTIVKGTSGGTAFFPNNTTKQNFYGPALTQTTFGTTWDSTDIDSLQLALYMPGTEGGSLIYDVWFEVVYNQKPVITVSAPTGTITNTNRVTVNINSYSDPEGDARERYQVKVFNAAQYGIAAFTPDFAPNTWDSGVVFGSNQTIAVNYDLPDGAYRAYARVSDAGSNARFSDWVYTSFTIALDPVPAPTIAVTADGANNRFSIVVNGKQNMLSNYDSTGQGTGSTWYSISGANAAAPSPSTDWTVHGSTSLKLTSQSSGGPFTMAAATGGATGNKNRTVVTPGTAYSVRAVAKAGATTRVVTLSVDWYKSNGTASTVQANSVVDTESVTTGGVQMSGTVTAPSDAASCEIRWSIASVGISESHYLDQVAMFPGTVNTWYRGGLMPYQKFYIERSFDGQYWTPIRAVKEWGSTPDASGNYYWTEHNPNSPDGEEGFSSTTPPDSNASWFKHWGHPWKTVEAVEDVIVPAGTQQVTVYDYEAPRVASVQYRARAYISAPDPYVAYTPYSNISGSGMNISTSGGDRWWFKVPYHPRLNRSFNMKGPNWSIASHETGAFFSPIGRKNKLKVFDVIQGDEFSLTAFIDSKQEFEDLKAIRLTSNKYGSPILIQAQDGRQWWANFGLDAVDQEIVLGQHVEYEMTFVEADALPS